MIRREGQKIEKIFDMIIIWGIFIFFIIISNYENKLSYRCKKNIVFFSIIIISIFMSKRSLGLDLVNYQKIYEDFSLKNTLGEFNITEILRSNYEPLFKAEMYFAKKNIFTFANFMFFHLLIPQIFLYFYIIKNKKNMILTYTVYILLNLFKMDVARQFSSNLFYLIALFGKNIWKYLLFSLASGLMHFSNLLTLFMKPLLNIKWNRIFFIFILLGACLFGVYAYSYILNIEEVNTITFKLKYYLEYNQKHYNFVNQSHKFVYYLQMFYLPIVMALFLNRNYAFLSNDNIFDKEIVNSLKIAIILFAIVLFIFNAPTMAIRLFDTYSVGIFLILVNYIYKSRRKYFKYYMFANLLIYNLIVSFYYLGTYMRWKI